VLAQGEIGTFSLVNLILFKIFPFVTAFNLGYVILFILFGIGMYAVVRELGLSRMVAEFCAISFTFTGFVIVQIPHYDHLQTFSYFPLLFWVFLRMVHHPKSKIWLAAPFLIAQQIFSGHPQYIYMEIVFFLMYILLTLRTNAKIYWVLFGKALLILGLTITISAIQLVPLFEFFLHSDRNFSVVPRSSGYAFGMDLSQFIHLINPYIGNLQNGIKDLTTASYWETFIYLELFPFSYFFLR